MRQSNDDPRIDPRIKAMMGAMPPAQSKDVESRCRQVMGTIHGTEIFAVACPEISRETAASIARFCREA